MAPLLVPQPAISRAAAHSQSRQTADVIRVSDVIWGFGCCIGNEDVNGVTVLRVSDVGENNPRSLVVGFVEEVA